MAKRKPHPEPDRRVERSEHVTLIKDDHGILGKISYTLAGGEYAFTDEDKRLIDAAEKTGGDWPQPSLDWIAEFARNTLTDPDASPGMREDAEKALQFVEETRQLIAHEKDHLEKLLVAAERECDLLDKPTDELIRALSEGTYKPAEFSMLIVMVRSAMSSLKHITMPAVLAGAAAQRVIVRRMEEHARRGKETLKAARDGHAGRYGSPDELERMREQYRQRWDREHKAHPNKSVAGLDKDVATMFGVSAKTVQRARLRK